MTHFPGVTHYSLGYESCTSNIAKEVMERTNREESRGLGGGRWAYKEMLLRPGPVSVLLTHIGGANSIN